jgi:cell division protein FtsB|tara:strand:- start:37 stop:225 length:189 start_codon:yes stop_codon:yes gene_type:complete
MFTTLTEARVLIEQWRREYGGVRIEQARKLKNLEKENARLKKLVADLSLDNAMLKEAAEGNF